MLKSVKETVTRDDIIKSIKAAIAFVDLEENPTDLDRVRSNVTKYSEAKELNLKNYTNGEEVNYIDYQGENITHAMRSVVRGMKSNKDIKSLVMPGTNLDNKTKTVFGGYIRDTDRLERVDLGGAISDEMSASIFGIALSDNKSLKSVDISGSRFNEDSIKEFARYIGDNAKLKLIGSDIESSVAEKIEEISGKKVYESQEVAEKKVSFADNGNSLKRTNSWIDSVGQNGGRKRSNTVYSEDEALGKAVG